jgi:O-antigen/teichoic acid export membrane protein
VTGPAVDADPGARHRFRGVTEVAARVGWGFADQAVSSLSNFLLGFVVARAVDTATFGAFSVAYMTYVVVLGIMRGAVAQPLIVRYSGVDEATWRSGSARAGGFAFVTGLVGGAVCLVIGLAIGGLVGPGLVALGITLPGLLVQDTWRYALFAGERGRKACLNDLLWLALQLPALGLVLLAGRDVGYAALLGWGGAGTVAALVGGRMVGVGLRPEASAGWLREHRILIPRYVAEATSSLTSSQLALYGVGAVAGLETLGELRVGQLLIGPVLVIFIGMQLVAVPMAVRALHVSIARLRRLCLAIGSSMAIIAVAWGGLLTLVPTELGRALLATNWEPAHRIVLVLALGLAASSFSSGALIGLRAFAAATRSLRATVISSMLTTVATILGAWLYGAAGAAWGIALSHSVMMPLWWWEFRRESARRAVETADAGPALEPSTGPTFGGNA